MLPQLCESIFGGTQFFALKKRPTSGEIEVQGRFQAKRTGAAGNRVSSIKQGYRRDEDATVGCPIRVNHRRNIV